MDGRLRSSLKLVVFVAVLTAVFLLAAMLNSASTQQVKPKPIKQPISTQWLPWKLMDLDHGKNNSGTMLETEYNSVDKNKHPFSSGVVLSDNYDDQVTTAVSNMMDLQCWAGQFNMSVVEPFLSGSLFTTGPTPGRLKFSSIFNETYWNAFCEKHHFSALVSWQNFLNFAPRSIIIAHVVVPVFNSPCAISRLKDQWSKLFRKHGFTVIKQACIKMRNTGYMDNDRRLTIGLLGQAVDVCITTGTWTL